MYEKRLLGISWIYFLDGRAGMGGEERLDGRRCVRQWQAGLRTTAAAAAAAEAAGEGDNLNGDRESERLTRPTPSL